MAKKERFVSLSVSRVGPSSERIKESWVVSYLWSRNIEYLWKNAHSAGIKSGKLKKKFSFKIFRAFCGALKWS